MKKGIEILAVTIISLLQFSSVVESNSDYSKITCKEDGVIKKHTMFLYPESGPSKACTGIISSGLSKSQIAQIVTVHNKLRQYVGDGKETRGAPGPQPKAKNMPNLEWDEELATIAQRWANQCDFDHDCADVARFSVGQNLAHELSSDSAYDIESMIHDWYDEVQFFDKKQVSSFVGDTAGEEDIGHYIQIVWAKTTKIGCGLIQYHEDGDIATYLVCNYGEAGNVMSKPVYQQI